MQKIQGWDQRSVVVLTKIDKHRSFSHNQVTDAHKQILGRQLNDSRFKMGVFAVINHDSTNGDSSNTDEYFNNAKTWFHNNFDANNYFGTDNLINKILEIYEYKFPLCLTPWLNQMEEILKG